MKKILLLCPLIALLFASGCSTLDKLYAKQVTTVPGQIIRTNTVTVTNIVYLPPSTNTTKGEIVPATIQKVIEPKITYDYAPPTYVTNLVQRSDIQAGLAVGESLPIPYLPIAASVFGGLYGLYMRFRNNQLNSANDDLSNLAVGLVKSVEQARNAIKQLPDGQNIDSVVTKALSSHQDSAGILAQVTGLLQEHTASTK